MSHYHVIEYDPATDDTTRGGKRYRTKREALQDAQTIQESEDVWTYVESCNYIPAAEREVQRQVEGGVIRHGKS